jgi:hypothetical protein
LIDRREIEGIGYHDSDYDGDYVLVDKWMKRPDDLKGQSLTIDKLLPRELRHAYLISDSSGSYDKRSRRQRFRFRIVVETEKVTEEP